VHLLWRALLGAHMNFGTFLYGQAIGNTKGRLI
jgi:hypothetical protein